MNKCILERCDYIIAEFISHIEESVNDGKEIYRILRYEIKLTDDEIKKYWENYKPKYKS